jgi:hypothetical protein
MGSTERLEQYVMGYIPLFGPVRLGLEGQSEQAARTRSLRRAGRQVGAADPTEILGAVERRSNGRKTIQSGSPFAGSPGLGLETPLRVASRRLCDQIQQIGDERRRLLDASRTPRERWGRSTSINLVVLATCAMAVPAPHHQSRPLSTTIG